MSSALIEYLTARPDAATFLLPVDYDQTIEDLFPHAEPLLPSVSPTYDARNHSPTAAE
jgi:hypothetical protein